MAEFRTVHTKTWRDEWFSELSSDGKVLWLYLLTNPATSVAGIYQLPFKFISFETGLPLDRVESLMLDFKSAGKIDFDGSVIWVKKMREYQATSSDKVEKRIISDFNSLSDCRVKGIYAQKYGIDTVSIPNPELVSDTDTETETDKKQNSADKPRTAEKETCPKEWVERINALCKIDAYTATVQARKNVSDCGKALIKGGAVIEALDTFERNWYALDWRGKQGQAPTVKQVRDEWGKYSREMNGNGSKHGTAKREPDFTAADYALAEEINARRAEQLAAAGLK